MEKKWFSFAEHFNTHNIFFSHILEFAWFSHDPTVWVAFLTLEGVSEENQLAHGYSTWAFIMTWFIFHYISVCICVGVGVCGCRETRGIKFSRCVVTGNCDLPDLGAGIQTWGFARTVHPYPLSHLSSPTGFLRRPLPCWGTLTVSCQSWASSLWTLLPSCLESDGPTDEEALSAPPMPHFPWWPEALKPCRASGKG